MKRAGKMSQALFGLAVAVSPGLAGTWPCAPVELKAEALKLEPVLKEIRQDMHRHPELGFMEVRTTARIKEELAKIPGIEVKPLAMKTGVLAELKGTKPEKGIVALRCDIDALPITEANTHRYVSLEKGKMHACGHDGHIAINLGAAMLLSKFRPERTVRFLFQPAEETTPSGAPDFLRCGVLDGVDEAWGFHLNATSDFGNVGWYDGTVMAGGTGFKISVKGKSVHSAYPEASVNPAVILSHVAVATEGLKSMIRATRPYSITLVNIHAGESTFATPHDGYLQGRIGFHEKEVDDFLRAKIKAIAEATATLYGGKAEIEYTDGLPITYNTPELGETVRAHAKEFGFPLEWIFPSMGSDDFAHYGVKVPTYYMTFGIRKGADFPIAHTQRFDFDEAILPVGAAMFASVAFR